MLLSGAAEEYPPLLAMKYLIAIAALGLLLAVRLEAQLPLRHESFGLQFFQGYGKALGRVADRDGDGADDILVGSPDLGRVDVVSGATGLPLAFISGPAPYEGFGHAVADLGDLDGDGISEIGVGAPGHDGNGADCGRVLVYSGATFSVLHDLIGDFAGDELGSTLLAWTDLDGDGKNEFAAGAPGTSSPGYIRLYSGTGLVLSSFWGATPGGGTGTALARIPDLDGDGLDELAVGSPWADFGGIVGCGRLQVLAGSGLNLLHDLGGATAGATFGVAVAAQDDIDGDGLADILIGASGDDSGGPDAGALFVVSGGTGQILRSHIGGQPFALLGNAVAALGDADGDGTSDYAVGSWFEDGTAIDSGALRVFSGAAGNLVLLQADAGTGAQLGRCLSGLGDIDGDGFADLAVGLPGSSGGQFLAGAVRVLSVGGFRAYGTSGFLPTMDLRFVPGGAVAAAAGAPPSLGHLQVEGAASWAPGLIAASLATANLDIGFLTVLVNPDPTLLVAQGNYGHDASGQAAFLLDASQPFLAGVSLFIQAYDLAFPYGASNGLEMRCLP